MRIILLPKIMEHIKYNYIEKEFKNVALRKINTSEINN